MFHFTRGQRNGLIVLSILIVIFISFPLVFKYFKNDYKPSFLTFEQEIDNARIAEKYSSKTNVKSPVKYFKFNPNLATKEELLSLGLTERQSNQILNFREKKGHFYTKADFKKIYAIDDTTYAKLEAFIDIPSKKKSSKFKKKQNYHKFKKKQYPNIIIEINKAQISDFEKIKGIGNTLAQRIIKYREALGGFLEKKQLQEVYGIDADRYQQIKSQIRCNKTVVKIRINYVSAKEIAKHPYISKQQAKAIIKKRTFGGRYQSINDLQKRLQFSDDLIQKITHYIEF